MLEVILLFLASKPIKVPAREIPMLSLVPSVEILLEVIVLKKPVSRTMPSLSLLLPLVEMVLKVIVVKKTVPRVMPLLSLVPLVEILLEVIMVLDGPVPARKDRRMPSLLLVPSVEIVFEVILLESDVPLRWMPSLSLLVP